MRREAGLMWLVILLVAVLAAAAGAFYMTVCVSRFSAVATLSRGKRWLKYLISFAIISALFAVIALSMSVVNATVIFLNEVVFFAFFGILFRVIAHIRGKEFTVNWQGWTALAVSIVYFVIGYYLANHVWQTDYTLKTKKDVSLKIAVFSDSHISTTFDGEGFAKHIKTIEKQNPDIVLIPGDYVDDWTKKEDMLTSCKALGEMKTKYGVFFSYGNHDEGFFNKRDFTAKELSEALINNGVHILSDSWELLDNSFYVVGRKDSSISEREDIKTLLKDLDSSKYIIVLDHEPNDYENEAKSSADLVVSGHTHGGQMLPVNRIGEWFNINDKTYGYENRNGTDFIVTSGISDWDIQFKTGTKSEYVIINLNK
ncbi:MAG: metallophosphoesterase [Clostridia bacterium]|nr:metallophosphoesterase [Clostridia bacterium]